MACSRWIVVSVAVGFLATIVSAENEWKRLSTGLSLSMFDGNDFSFDVKDNLAYCNKQTKKINLDDSVADYTSIFNKALAELGKGGKGGTLRLGPGVFPHSGQIVIPSYVCLVGSGMSKTTIRLKDQSKKFRLSGNIRSFQTERVTVMDLTQDGNADNQRSADKYGRYGYFHELTNYVYLKNVKIMNNYGYGFDPHGSKKEWSFYLVIDGCEATKNGFDGFTLDQTYYVSMLNSRSYENVRHGYNLVTGLKVVLVKNNKSYKNGLKGDKVGCGYMVQNNHDLGTRDVRFVKDEATGNNKAGFCLNDVTGISIKDCTVSGAPSTSTYCFQVFHTFGKNEIKGNVCKLPSNRLIKDRDAKYEFDTSDSGSGNTGGSSGGSSGSSGMPEFPFLTSSDSTCSIGIKKGSYCCQKQCGTCGGTGCGKRAADNICCTSGIKGLNRSCSEVGAPCTLASDSGSGSGTTGGSSGGSSGSGGVPEFPFLTSSDSTCSIGIKKGSYCCQKQCGTCGGTGCGKRAADNICCTSGIKGLNRSCSEVGAPCTLASAAPPSEPTTGGGDSNSFKYMAKKDPECSNGIRGGDECCPKACGYCGGDGCYAKAAGGVCCRSKVAALNRSCSEVGVPCSL